MKCCHFNSHENFLAYEYVMPRKPTFDHPVRRLRETIGLTQPQFAKMLGVGKDAIQSIENGRRPLSKHLAFKVRRQTGCVLKRTAGKGEHEAFEVRNLSTETLRAYTKDDFQAHQQKLRGILDEDFGHTIQAASSCIALLLRAAAERGAGTAMAVCEDFEQLMTSSFESYKLAPQLRGLLHREWAGYNANLDIELVTKNFPLAPLSTAYSFPVEALIRSETADPMAKNPTKVAKKPVSPRKTKA